VAAVVRSVTRLRRTLFVLIGLVVIFAIAALLGVGQNPPLDQRAERNPELRDGGRGFVSASTATLVAGGLALVGVALGLYGDQNGARSSIRALREPPTRTLKRALQRIFRRSQKGRGSQKFGKRVESRA
jgi:hypothetical protein